MLAWLHCSPWDPSTSRRNRRGDAERVPAPRHRFAPDSTSAEKHSGFSLFVPIYAYVSMSRELSAGFTCSTCWEPSQFRAGTVTHSWRSLFNLRELSAAQAPSQIGGRVIRENHRLCSSARTFILFITQAIAISLKITV